MEQVKSNLPSLSSSYIKVPYCGCLVQEESPDELTDAIVFFLLSLRSYLPYKLIDKFQQYAIKW